MRNIRKAVLVACILFSACELFPESVFMLSSESRLPRWFQIPEGIARSQLTVEMSYYYDHVKFVFADERSNRRIATVRGKVIESPSVVPISMEPPLGAGVAVGARAHFSIVKMNDIVEIIVHKRKEPIFDISDDPAIRDYLFRTSGNAELLK